MRRERPNPLPWHYRWRTNLIQTPLFGLITAICGSLVDGSFACRQEGQCAASDCENLGAGLRLGIWVKAARYVGAENLRKHQVAVYASNHTSYMDTPVIFAALPFQFRILARKHFGVSHSLDGT